jgi:PAS domain S-box-containing protein
MTETFSCAAGLRSGLRRGSQSTPHPDSGVRVGSLAAAGRAGHLVQFYDDDEFLCEMVCDYVSVGLIAGEPIVIIATADHQKAFTDALRGKSFDLDPTRAGRQVTLLDAGETLAKFMRDGVPDAELFRKHVGSLVRQVRAQHEERPARAYGEMVDVLWKSGNRQAAIRLEQMWNELATVEELTLLCGYGMDGFHSARDLADFERVCSCHSHVLPAESFSKLESDDSRLREIGALQQRARALEAEIARGKALEAELRASEDELRDFVDNAVEGVHWVDANGVILYANKAELSLLGYSQSEYVGKSITEFHVDRDVIEDMLTRLRRGETIADYEARLRSKDGAIKHVLVNSNVLFRDGRFVHTRCFSRDITARKRAEESLRFLAEASTILASSLDYEATLSSVAKLAVPKIADCAACVIFTVDGRMQRLAVEHVDPTKAELARELLARCPPNVNAAHGVGHVIRTGKAEHDQGTADAVLEASSEGVAALAFANALGLQSSIRVPLAVRGHVVGAFTLAWDQPGRHATTEDVGLAEDLARRAGLAIENAVHYKAAADASVAKDEFLAVVSHELRTPLNAILGWVHMLRENAVPEGRQQHALETIERNARAQNQLIDDLLDVSRIVSGKLRLDVAPVDLQTVVERAIETVRPAAAAKNISLKPTLNPDASPVMGDADRLQQVVWNLLSNAVKFSPNSSDVHVVLCRRESNVELMVRDHGQGIEPLFLPHVFERFRQADASAARGKGGLGLGLAIVRNLVELHGGSIRAESEGPGRGSAFTVSLPISPLRSPSFVRPPVLHLTAVAPHLEYPSELEGIDVLVVDDEADARELLSALLARGKMRVTTAATVEEAMALVGKNRPDIVISDIGMPERDGYVLIKRLRALAPQDGGRTPTVALTAFARTEERTKALVSGFNMHVAKPVEPAELLAVLASLAAGFQKTRG